MGNDTRLFVNVIRYLAKTGIAWADLPTAAGKWNSLWARYTRWCERGGERVAAPSGTTTPTGCWWKARASAPARPHLPALIAGVKTRAVPADKWYDADTNREAIHRQGAEPCIPPRKNQVAPVEYDRHLYRERNGVERFFAHLKPCRRVATRYDKTAKNSLGFVRLATIGIVFA